MSASCPRFGVAASLTAGSTRCSRRLPGTSKRIRRSLLIERMVRPGLLALLAVAVICPAAGCGGAAASQTAAANGTGQGRYRCGTEPNLATAVEEINGVRLRIDSVDWAAGTGAPDVRASLTAAASVEVDPSQNEWLA